jgi:cytochrome c oxidase subunit 1
MSAEGHGHDHEHEHHHKDTFITKYIFSIDHKMIATILNSGIIMGIIGVVCLALECNWHGQRSHLRFLMYYLVINAPNGVMTNDIYLSLVTYTEP